MKKITYCLLLILFFSLSTPLFAEETPSYPTIPSVGGNTPANKVASTTCAVFAGIFGISGLVSLTGALYLTPIILCGNIDQIPYEPDLKVAEDMAITGGVLTLAGLIFLIPAIVLSKKKAPPPTLADQEVTTFRGTLTSENIPEWSIVTVESDSEQTFSFQF